MKYPQLFANQFAYIDKNPDNLTSPTRSSKTILPFHSAIADDIENFCSLQTQSLRNGKEYNFIGAYGSKKVDIALLDRDTKELKGAIFFKGIRSSYNKNANNFIENMHGESALLLDSGIKVYQIIFIPTSIRNGNKYETPTDKSFINYNNFISFAKTNNYWKNLKIGVYCIDIDYNNYSADYSSKIVEGVEGNLTCGIQNFCQEVLLNG